ncbi:uncharacterized protein MELLADRAFT_33377 [Melampsora larici-populina 98AG31]|uniref:Sorbose reductase sou1 n=1 Tax=Melampsora larici-populina (strain 98AG31 / pathotype 3-4-7) TaxID=747676 RepID=F4R8X8_MELLP|nr:uncharacterized protein MELLADRAFT_33377 [Melampsora larici-populina 98AG31]EGG10887.1 hypothetical protein MELLADRAFT_33377 [Melampsora larici-populina 98AG31]
MSYPEHREENGLSNGKISNPLPIGVAAARQFFENEDLATKTISDEFKLQGKCALVTGANGGLGLEMALVLAELGAIVYAVDLAESPSKDFTACANYARKMFSGSVDRDRMYYRRVDVTDQTAMRDLCKLIVDAEGTLDVCVAAAGILHDGGSCLNLSVSDFQRVMDVNTNGVFITAAAAASEMVKRDIGGSIIMVASMSGSITNKDHAWIAYNTSKSAVLQMARSMACELGSSRIRVNSLSPGHVRTAMTQKFLVENPFLEEKWSSMNPLGRLGKVHEVRGVTAWLASDASSFCTGSDIIVSGGHHSW